MYNRAPFKAYQVRIMQEIRGIIQYSTHLQTSKHASTPACQHAKPRTITVQQRQAPRHFLHLESRPCYPIVDMQRQAVVAIPFLDPCQSPS